MGSDKARITYDEKQQYRSVVMQQGRVTLEADWNEAQEIRNEDLRKDALDIVGPAGTPDDGYGVSALSEPKFDLAISAGTMYVGGERVELEQRLHYSNQPDWLDHLIDPDFIDLSAFNEVPPQNEFVYLFLREQEVSAVEDSSLREVALGGPDTAARLRLIQHIVRAKVRGDSCASGLKESRQHWTEEGLRFAPATMRLLSNSTLELGFSNVETEPDPCEPAAQGGYLGADNQLIRVQISDAAGHKFLWGYDNASFLYRIDVKNPNTVALQSAPVDAFHEPKSGQTVEVLMAAAHLHNGEFVAAHSGFVTKVNTYVRDGQQITLADALPAVYGDGDPNHPKPPRVFLRVWQEELPFTPGTAVGLTQTGLEIKLRSRNGPFHTGDFWQIAVRPSTPTRAYPERYLNGPQPPDGPRMWACPLAAIQWTEANAHISDCRNPFDNLVELTGRKLGGCCTVTLRPQDGDRGQNLQAVIDSLKGKGPSKICLTPGVYLLSKSLLLTPENAGLTIEACPGKAILRPAGDRGDAFGQGMFVLNRADNVTLNGLTFELPQGRVSNKTNDPLAALTVAIGIRPLNCRGLTVEHCEFVFPVGEQRRTLFGVGIFAGSRCEGLRLCENRFLGGRVAASANDTVTVIRNPALRLLVGFLHTPTFVPGTLARRGVAAKRAMLLRAALDDATIRNNYFERLTASSLILADTGALAINDNQVLECYAGFWVLALATLLANANPTVTTGTSTAPVSTAVLNAAALISFDSIVLATVLGALKYPLPAEFDAAKGGAIKQKSTPVTVKESSLLNNAANLVRLHLTADATATTSEVKAKADATVTDAATQPGRAESANAVRAEIFPDFADALFGFAAAVFNHELSLSLDFSHNEVSTVLNKLVFSTALLVIDADQTTDSQVTVSSNRLRSQSLSATAGIFFVNRCTVTGNLVFNEQPEKGSLFLIAPLPSQQKVPPAGTAITGNVFGGLPVLAAPRPVFAPPAPAPMDKWEFFNTRV